jgi:hypothetical protein
VEHDLVSQDHNQDNQAEWGPWMQQAPDASPAAHNPIAGQYINVDLNVGLIDEGPDPNFVADIPDLNIDVALEENALVHDLNLHEDNLQDALYNRLIQLQRLPSIWLLVPMSNQEMSLWEWSIRFPMKMFMILWCLHSHHPSQW